MFVPDIYSKTQTSWIDDFFKQNGYIGKKCTVSRRFQFALSLGIICEELVNYLEKHKILYEFQFGFRKGHSTSQAIAEIADNLRNAIDNNLYSCGVFLDFSKAFDTVNHTILLKKNGTLRDTRRASPTFCKLSHK